MKLGDFLKKKDITIVEFGRMLGVHPSQLSRYINKVNVPCALQIYKISKITKGQVKLEDWIDDQDKVW